MAVIYSIYLITVAILFFRWDVYQEKAKLNYREDFFSLEFLIGILFICFLIPGLNTILLIVIERDRIIKYIKR